MPCRKKAGKEATGQDLSREKREGWADHHVCAGKDPEAERQLGKNAPN